MLQKKTKFKTLARVADGGDLLAPFTTPSPWEQSRVGSVETDTFPIKFIEPECDASASLPFEMHRGKNSEQHEIRSSIDTSRPKTEVPGVTSNK